MKIIPTEIPDVLIIEPKVFGDDRGFFLESFNEKAWQQATGLSLRFVQDNHSRSAGGVLRGLHYQVQQPQGKLIRAVVGEIFDVAVDIRRQSPTFGQCVSTRLSAENKRMLWIPAGFAHGFYAVSPWVECLYKTTDYYAPQHERSILWNDPDLSIEWPLEGEKGREPVLSAKDKAGSRLKDAQVYP